MRILILLPLIGFLSCAGEKLTSENQPVDNALVAEPLVTKELTPHFKTLPDTTVYIGPVYAFVSTQEYYTPLFFNDSMAISPDALRESLDSVIYRDTDEQRVLVKPVAVKNFYLAGLDTISVFDDQGERLYRARLAHIEYFDTSIEGEFIGVYKPIGKIQFRKDVSYCVSQGEHLLKEVPSKLQAQNNEGLSKKLIDVFQINTTQLQSIKHFTSSDSITYSIVSTRNGSSLVETKGEKSIELMKRDDNILLTNIIPTQFEVNDHPVFLAEFGLADTDAMWVSLLTFSEGLYQANVRNRIHF